MDWQKMRGRLAPLGTRWDLAVLANLADRDGPVRPADLMKAINAQSRDGGITWKVLEARLRRLEAAGYVLREQVPHRPRETWYSLLVRGDRLIAALTRLDAWYDEQPSSPGSDGGGAPA